MNTGICSCWDDAVKIKYITVTRQQPTTAMFVQINIHHFRFIFLHVSSLLSKRFSCEVTACCVCYCYNITSVLSSGLTCWVIPAFVFISPTDMLQRWAPTPLWERCPHSKQWYSPSWRIMTRLVHCDRWNKMN